MPSGRLEGLSPGKPVWLLHLLCQLMQFLKTGELTWGKNSSNSFCWPSDLSLLPAGDADVPAPGKWWGWGGSGQSRALGSPRVLRQEGQWAQASLDPAPQGCPSAAQVLPWVHLLQEELFIIAYSSDEITTAPCAPQLELQEGAEARRLHRKVPLRLKLLGAGTAFDVFLVVCIK